MKPLKASQLKTNLPLSQVTSQTSQAVAACDFQPRVLRTLNLGLSLNDPEYNIYIDGEEGLGRTFMVQEFLADKAAALPTPPDLIYVCNFEDEDRPKLLELSAGQGKILRSRLSAVMKEVVREIPRHFEQDAYISQHDSLIQAFSDSRDAVLDEMEQKAQAEGFSLNIDETGALSLYPLVEGKVLTPEEYEKLPPSFRQQIKSQSGQLMELMVGMSRQLSKEEQNLKQSEKKLNENIAGSVLQLCFADMEKEFADNAQVKAYLEGLQKDILENLDRFKDSSREEQEAPQELGVLSSGEDFNKRYEVNLFVDNASQQGAPIVVEYNPGYFNLMGCIERQTEWGTYYTDFSLIKAGSLHKANGGFLIIRTDDLLAHPGSWEGLLRCLRSGMANVEDPPDRYETVRIKTIEPAGIPLQIKVILIGNDETYELLLTHDERFRKLFKLKAHVQDSCERNKESIALYLSALRQLTNNKLPALDKSGLAELVDYSSRLAQDQQKLSLYFPLLREIIFEAGAMAKSQNKKYTSRQDITLTLQEREYRNNLYEQEFLHEYDRQIIKVQTEGQAIGMVNGLSVSQIGDFVMGLPHQISTNVGVGHGGIMDLEREAELGGPIHTKGMMILKSYLMRMFAQQKPLVLSASICFEQSYAHVDGDSASGAELVSLLSALSGIPVRLSLAFTGAVSQSGLIMAVGEVTRKVEGFFEVCKRRGLSGRQGVLIPKDNMPHLMLKDEVVQAVAQQRFHIYAVEDIAQALHILTGVKAGNKLARGNFSPGSIFALVDDRLRELAALAEAQVKRPRKKKDQ